MPIAQRVPSSGTAASGAGFSITLPASVAAGDFLILAVANAGTAGPAAPTGWTQMTGSPWSAGTAQSISCYWAQYSVSLTLAFTNAASVAAWACNAFFMSGYAILLDGNPVAASNVTSNTTLPTGAPTTGTVAGDFEALAYCWTSAATITTTASGSTIDGTRANSTLVSVSLGHNNTTSLGASTATTAFSHTLSAANTRKTGVGILLRPLKLVSGVTAGVATASGSLSGRRSLTASASGTATVNETLNDKRALVAASTGAASVSVAISDKRVVVGTSTGAATASGVVSKLTISYKNLTGTSAGVATSTATATHRRPVSGTSNGVATVAVQISVGRALTGTSAGVASVATQLSDRRSLAGSSVGAASVAASVSDRRSLTGISSGTATIVAATSRRRSLAAVAAGSSVATAATSAMRSVSGLSAGTSSASITTQLGAGRSLIGVAHGTSGSDAIIDMIPAVAQHLALAWVGITGVPANQRTIPLTLALNLRAQRAVPVSVAFSGVPLPGIHVAVAWVGLVGVEAAPTVERTVPVSAVFSIAPIIPPQPTYGPGTGGSAGLQPRFVPPVRRGKPHRVLGYIAAEGKPGLVTARGTVAPLLHVGHAAVVGRPGVAQANGQVVPPVVAGRAPVGGVLADVVGGARVLPARRGVVRVMRQWPVSRATGRVLDSTRGTGSVRALDITARATGQVSLSPTWELEELWLLGVGSGETDEELVLT